MKKLYLILIENESLLMSTVCLSRAVFIWFLILFFSVRRLHLHKIWREWFLNLTLFQNVNIGWIQVINC